MKNFVIALSALGLLAGSAPALAATQCRNKAGKFVKCPVKASLVKAKMCRDSKGHFSRCK